MCGHVRQAHLPSYQGMWQTMCGHVRQAHLPSYQGGWQPTCGHVRQAHLPRQNQERRSSEMSRCRLSETVLIFIPTFDRKKSKMLPMIEAFRFHVKWYNLILRHSYVTPWRHDWR